MSEERELLRALQDLLAGADVDASALVEGAWQEAQDEVRATLRRLMARDLLERALRSLDGAPAPTGTRQALGVDAPTASDAPPATEPRDPAPPAAGAPSEGPGPDVPRVPAGEDGTRATYLFGIVAAGTSVPPTDQPPLPGGGPIRLLPLTGCAAVVCDVDPALLDTLRDPGPDALDLLVTVARAHDATLARFVQAPVLPLSLGTVLADDEAVEQLLLPHLERLTAELERFAGRAEWAVTVRPTGATTADAASSDADAATSGRAYLEGRQEALRSRDERWRDEQELADAVHEPLAAVAREAQRIASRPMEERPPLLHGVYLVEEDEQDRFTSTIAYLRDQHPDTAIEATGPWPPYHFTQVELATGTGAEA